MLRILLLGEMTNKFVCEISNFLLLYCTVYSIVYIYGYLLHKEPVMFQGFYVALSNLRNSSKLLVETKFIMLLSFMG